MNKRELYRDGYFITVSRRFLNKVSGRTRVRVIARTMSGKVLLNEYRDYDDMHRADTAYSRLIREYEGNSEA